MPTSTLLSVQVCGTRTALERKHSLCRTHCACVICLMLVCTVLISTTVCANSTACLFCISVDYSHQNRSKRVISSGVRGGETSRRQCGGDMYVLSVND